MITRSPMTVAGHKRLQEELQNLKNVERFKLAKQIEEARAHGDLSENAEYHAAKEAQGLMEAKIRDLESRMATAQVVDVSALSGTKVVFGATVDLSDVDTGEEKTVTIVGEDEADPDNGLISYKSPIARALIGKELDDLATVKLPSGKKEYEIRDVRFG
jgi:transcription elongation factor GreA